MRKVYILIFSDAFATKESLKSILNRIDIVLTWRSEMPHCFFIVSESSAQEISDRLTQLLPLRIGRLLITELSSNRQGLLSKESWHLFREKKLQTKS